MDSNHTCVAVVSLDSALKKDGNYYPQVFLKECKYIDNILYIYILYYIVRHINDNLLPKQVMHTKKQVVFLKLCLQYIKMHETMFTIHSNTINYTTDRILIFF